MACPHGFAPSECLICKTLQDDRSVAVDRPGKRGVTTSHRRSERTFDTRTGGIESAGDGRPAGRSHDAERSQGRTHGRTVAEIVAVLVVIVVAVAAIGLATEVVRGLFHVLDLALVAIVAAVVGYGAGRAHGRRRKSD